VLFKVSYLINVKFFMFILLNGSILNRNYIKEGIQVDRQCFPVRVVQGFIFG
jgi:hypothetical protein